MESICKLVINDCRALFYKHHLYKLLCNCNVHSSIEQFWSQSPVNTIWWYFQLLSAEVSLKISCKYHQIVSTEDCAKQYFRNEWTLVSMWVRNFWLPFKEEVCFKDPGNVSLLHTFVKEGSMYLNWNWNIIGKYYTGQFLSEFYFNLSYI